MTSRYTISQCYSDGTATVLQTFPTLEAAEEELHLGDFPTSALVFQGAKERDVGETFHVGEPYA